MEEVSASPPAFPPRASLHAVEGLKVHPFSHNPSWTTWVGKVKERKRELISLVRGLLHIIVAVGKDVEKKILLNSGEDRLQVAEFHLRRGVRLREAAVHVARLRTEIELDGGSLLWEVMANLPM